MRKRTSGDSWQTDASGLRQLDRRGREKKSIEYLCVDSPANLAIFEELRAIDAEVQALNKKFRDIAAKIERVNPQI